MRRGHLGSPQGLKHTLNIFSISSYQSRVEWMGRSLTTNEESRWATPLSFLALSSSACWRRRKRASFFTYRCWRFQSSVWGGRGRSLLDAQSSKEFMSFCNRCFLATFFSWDFFQGFYLLRLVWSSRFKLDYHVQFSLVFSFCVFFLVVGGGRIIARWALWRLLCTFAVLEVLWGSFNRLLFPFLVCFFFGREPTGMLLKQ
jgi:hypothetical protein